MSDAGEGAGSSAVRPVGPIGVNSLPVQKKSLPGPNKFPAASGQGIGATYWNCSAI
jgi:hypothetical protein